MNTPAKGLFSLKDRIFSGHGFQEKLASSRHRICAKRYQIIVNIAPTDSERRNREASHTLQEALATNPIRLCKGLRMIQEQMRFVSIETMRTVLSEFKDYIATGVRIKRSRGKRQR
jgi:hypothetical protein